MNKTILQVPLNKQVKDAAEKAANAQGFSSLQEAVRLFLNKLAQGTMQVTFEETIHLSNKAIARYDDELTHIVKEKNIYDAEDVDDLVKQLQNAS